MRLSIWPRSAAVRATDSVLFRSPHVLATTQGDDTILLDTRSDRYYTLNAVGSRIWALLANGATREEICGTIRREYAMPPSDDGLVERDVTQLLQSLAAAALVSAAR